MNIIEIVHGLAKPVRNRNRTRTEPRSGIRSTESAGSGCPEPLSQPRTTTHFMVFLLTHGRYGGKSAHFWPSYARLGSVPGIPGSVTVGLLGTDYPSRSVPGSQIRTGNDLYQIYNNIPRY